MSTRICVSVAEESTADAIDRMVDLAPVADLFEIRGDAMEEVDLLTLLRARVKPLLFCCRPRRLGGRHPGDESRRHLLLMEAARRGVDYVDLEDDSPFDDVAEEKAGRGLVVSHHDFDGMPDDLDSIYQRICARSADIAKIAVTPRGFGDVVRLVEFAIEVASSGGTPLVPIAMGPYGLLTRILAGRWKSPFTYAAPRTGSETAPGQVPADVLGELYRAREISAATRVYGLVGNDVSQSPSPAIHNRAFAAAGLDAVYVPFCAEALAPFLDAVPVLHLAGFAITRPFKRTVVSALQDVDGAAAAAGSVNTVVVEHGRLRGLSTDGTGVVEPLKQHTSLARKSVIVLGAGGAARAAAFALLKEGAYVKVLARKPAEALAVARELDCGSGTLGSLPQLTWDVIVNATPVGSGPLAKESLVPAEAHRPGSVVLDMVYEPAETRLLREARAAGCAVVTGREMLVAQAIPQFESWTGQRAPVEVMRQAVDA